MRSDDVAVVVSLEDYAFVPDVPHARHDGVVAGDLFVYTLGVAPDRPISLQAGGREQIEAAVKQAGQLAGPEQRVWVYFAGHGAASPSSGKRPLLGDDVRSDPTSFEARGVGVDEVLAWASAAGAEPVLLLDTCYGGVGRDGAERLGGIRLAVPAHAVEAPTGMVWTAAAADEVSGPLPGGTHGAFTYFAVGALRGWADGELTGTPDGRIDLDEAQAFVRKQLATVQVRSQTPSVVGTTVRPLSRGAESMDTAPALPPTKVLGALTSPVPAPRLPRITPGEGVDLVTQGRYETRYGPNRALLETGGTIAAIGGLVALGTWGRYRFGTPLTEAQWQAMQPINIVGGRRVPQRGGAGGAGAHPRPHPARRAGVGGERMRRFVWIASGFAGGCLLGVELGEVVGFEDGEACEEEAQCLKALTCSFLEGCAAPAV